jgi:hypothetical protein
VIYPQDPFANEVMESLTSILSAVEDRDLDVALDHVAKLGAFIRKEREVRVLEAAVTWKPATPPNCDCQGGLVPAPWEGERHQLGAPCSVFGKVA